MPAVWGLGSRRARKSDGYNTLAHKYWHQVTYFSLSFTSMHKNDPKNVACWVVALVISLGGPIRRCYRSHSLICQSEADEPLLSNRKCDVTAQSSEGALLNDKHNFCRQSAQSDFLFITARLSTPIQQLYFHNIVLTYIHIKMSKRASEFFGFKKLHVKTAF